MRVFDCHIHIGRRDQITPWLTEYFEREFSREALDFLHNLTPETVVGMLDGFGVEKVAILAEYTPPTTGVIPSEFVAEFCSSSDRLIAVGSVDLNSDEDGGLQVERCVKVLGCKAIKLLPSYAHVYPDDPRLMPAYEAAAGLGIPVMFHTGTSLFPGSRIRYAHPLLLDDIADEFPGLMIVMCHGGRPFWYKECEWMLARHRNVHIDIAGIPPVQLPKVFPKLERFTDRFLFGSDWPTQPRVGDAIRTVRELPYPAAVIQAVLWENGARLFGLEEDAVPRRR